MSAPYADSPEGAPVRRVCVSFQGMMDPMAEKGNPVASEAGMAVLAAVRGLLEDTKPAQEAQDGLTGGLLALGAMGRAMQRDWSPAAQYQAIALLSATVLALSKITGKSEEEILADLESNCR
jgi:hypothetical protein